MKILHKRLTAFLAAVLIACSVILAAFLSFQPVAAFAVTGSLDMDRTDVMDDLRGSSVDGEQFNVAEYGFDESKPTTVLYLAEYCYSFYASRRGNYNLYLYVWNPKGLNLLGDSVMNTVQLSFGEANAVPSAKYRLSCMSVSTERNYEGLFYKFRVELSSAQKETVLKTLNSSNRIYHVSEIELMERGNYAATSFYVNKVFTYSGYSIGYGPNEGGDTLSYSMSHAETLDIERQGGLHTTFFRPQGVSSADGYTQDTLQSVYFSVPEKFFQDDYELVTARMEWLFAQTQYGLVTGNQELYRSLLEWVGQTNEGKAEGLSWENEYGQAFPTRYAFESHFGSFNSNRNILSDMPYLAYLFPSEDWGIDSADDYVVPWEEILQWMRNYHEQFDSEDKTYWDPDYERTHLAGQTPEKGANVQFHRPFGGDFVTVDGVEYPYSRALFSYVASGKTTMDITSDKTFSLLDLTLSERLKWFDDGYLIQKDKYVSDTNRYDEIKAIHVVDESDFKTSEAATCLELYIDEADYKNFKEFYDEAVGHHEKVVLVRYDVSKYYSCEAKEGIPRTGSLVTGYDPGDTNARVFSLGVYLGLDLIHLEFDNGDVRFFLPVASTPIDAGSDSTPSYDTTSDKSGWPEWLKWTVGVIALILAIILLWPILPLIIKAVVWVVTLPFKLIAAIVKALKKPKEKRRNGKE